MADEVVDVIVGAAHEDVVDGNDVEEVKDGSPMLAEDGRMR